MLPISRIYIYIEMIKINQEKDETQDFEISPTHKQTFI